MKLLRLSGSFAAVGALALLAACGGGGGGGSVTPPGGGGGGGTPPPSTPTPASSSSPTPSPSSSPGGVTVTVSGNVSAEENFQNFSQLWYTSGTASWNVNNTPGTAGDTSSAPSGAKTDGMQCQQVSEGTGYPQTAFSQHVFLGIYNGSTWEDVPSAVGMVNSTPPVQSTPNPSGTPYPSNFYEVEQNKCEYNMHTHDFSGLVHVEDQSMAQGGTFPAYATLKNLFDLWGATLSANGITAGGSTLTGKTVILIGLPTAKDANGNDLVNSYTQYTTDANGAGLQFSRHEAIWIVVNPTNPVKLPAVHFVVSN